MYQLYLGNKNYSSWSLRGFLAMKLSGALVRRADGVAVRRTRAQRVEPVVLADRAHSVPARRRDGGLGFAGDRRISRRAASGHVAGRSGGPRMGAVRLRGDAFRFFGVAQRHDDVHPRARRRASVVAGRAEGRRARDRDLERGSPSATRRAGRISAAPIRSPTFSMRRSHFAFAPMVSRPRARPATTCNAALRHPFVRSGRPRPCRKRRSSTATSRGSSIATRSRRKNAGASMSEAILGGLQARIRAAAAAKDAAGDPRRRHARLLRADDRRRRARRDAVRRHRRLRPDRARGDRARRHARRGDRRGAPVRRDRCWAASRRDSARRQPLGGLVATGLSGPRRPYAGAVRDIVLGVRMLDGNGDDLTFGGRVMKNVAGFDVARLMTGALGTLGVLTEVSLKCLPLPKVEATRVARMLGRRRDPDDERVGRQAAAGLRDLPSRGPACGAPVRIGAGGRRRRVEDRRYRDGGRAQPSGKASATSRIRTFARRSSSGAPTLAAFGQVDGAVSRSRRRTADRMGRRVALARRRAGAPMPREVRGWAKGNGGHATLFRAADKSAGAFHPLPEAVHQLHRRLKSTFDPAGILNRGRLYPDF